MTARDGAAVLAVELAARGVDVAVRADDVPQRVLCNLGQCEPEHLCDRYLSTPPEIIALRDDVVDAVIHDADCDSDPCACGTDAPTWPDPTARPRLGTTGPEHYAEAERLAADVDRDLAALCDPSQHDYFMAGCAEITARLAAAQVHATLALAAATVQISGRTT